MSYLNPRLDLAALRGSLSLDHRVQIRNFFEPPVVEALATELDAIDWRLLFRDESGDRKLTGEQVRALSTADRMALTARINALAENEYQYLFHSHSMVDTAKAGEADLLTRFVRWMADDEFMSAMRALTGIGDINRVYAQATLYGRGNFLLMHNDETPLEQRRVAYVINLTRHWRPDWGGLLHFADDEGNVRDTFFPHFNSLSLFTVPQRHFVSYVAPYAQGQRCAITGWLIAA